MKNFLRWLMVAILDLIELEKYLFGIFRYLVIFMLQRADELIPLTYRLRNARPKQSFFSTENFFSVGGGFCSFKTGIPGGLVSDAQSGNSNLFS